MKTIGNLLNDGSRSYAYDDLDRLIQVTQGISTTLYGYTGDGDRLWQKTDGVTTTFTLDLNGALAQVLAQSQGSALTTVNFLPGIGQQQSGGYWTYFHADALGSVRDLSGVTGNAIGHVDTSPFGEIVNSTGMASWFGFTGEQQDGSSGLAYLRARYYDPANGRFLTPDSLIPDITNGQSLNAYAYVYNDPINLVDPSGYFGIGDAAVWGATHAPDSWKSGIRDFAGGGLTFLNWWKAKPENCECNQNPELTTNAALLVNEWGANQGTQLAWSGATTPAKIIAESVSYQTRSLQGEVFIYREVATKTGVDVTKWGAWGPHGRPYTQVTNLADGYYAKTTGAAMKVKNPRLQLVEGMRGFEGAIVGAGYIDAGFQLAGDLVSNLCLSPEQLAWRAMIAFGFGIVAGTVGAVVGASVAGAGIVSYSAPAIAGFGASLFATYKLRPIKTHVLDKITGVLN